MSEILIKNAVNRIGGYLYWINQYGDLEMGRMASRGKSNKKLINQARIYFVENAKFIKELKA